MRSRHDEKCPSGKCLMNEYYCVDNCVQMLCDVSGHLCASFVTNHLLVFSARNQFDSGPWLDTFHFVNRFVKNHHKPITSSILFNFSLSFFSWILFLSIEVDFSANAHQLSSQLEIWSNRRGSGAKRQRRQALHAEMDNSSDEISIESDPSKGSHPGLKYVTHWPPVNIEFQDLVYSVPDIQGKGHRCTGQSHISSGILLFLLAASANTKIIE